MKLLNICFALLALTFAQHASAQDKINIVKVGGNLLATVLGEDSDETYGGFSAALEHQLRSKTSLVFGVNYNTKESTLSDGIISISARLSIVTFEPEFRWYPKAVTEGFYLGFAPAVYLQKAKISGAISGEGDDTRVGAGLKLGYQFALNNRLKLQFGTGGGLILPGPDSDGSLQFNLNALVGYQF